MHLIHRLLRKGDILQDLRTQDHVEFSSRQWDLFRVADHTQGRSGDDVQCVVIANAIIEQGAIRLDAAPYVEDAQRFAKVDNALLVADYLRLYGPVRGWWMFPFERVIGDLQRTNTNSQQGE